MVYNKHKFKISSPNINQKYPKPFLKWAGGKSQLLPEINMCIPKDIRESKRIKKYFEPFLGGGAVFFSLISNYRIGEVYLSDINNELILTYNVVKENPKELIEKLKILSDEYPSEKEDIKEYYYGIRKSFNNNLVDFDFENYSEKHMERAAQFIFLNKTCFNGLFRVNKKCEFNVPCAYTKNPLICDESNILNVSKSLQNVNLKCVNYLELEPLIDDDSLVYLDPPYKPLNNSSSFNGYSKYRFDDDNQIELAEFYKRISNKGAKAILSNSDPKNNNESDNFFDDLYSDYNIGRVKAKRNINSKGNKRGYVSEILITNY